MKTFSEELKEARIARGLTLEELGATTKIRVKILRALETGNFGILPQTYIKGFLRTYAVQVGLDPSQIVAKYEAYQRSTVDVYAPVKRIETRPSRQSPWKLIGSLLGILVVLLFGVYLLSEYKNGNGLNRQAEFAPGEMESESGVMEDSSLISEADVESDPVDSSLLFEQMTLPDTGSAVEEIHDGNLPLENLDGDRMARLAGPASLLDETMADEIPQEEEVAGGEETLTYSTTYTSVDSQQAHILDDSLQTHISDSLMEMEVETVVEEVPLFGSARIAAPVSLSADQSETVSTISEDFAPLEEESIQDDTVFAESDSRDSIDALEDSSQFVEQIRDGIDLTGFARVAGRAPLTLHQEEETVEDTSFVSSAPSPAEVIPPPTESTEREDIPVRADDPVIEEVTVLPSPPERPNSDPVQEEPVMTEYQGPVTLEIEGIADTWLHVRADDEAVYEGMMRSGSSASWQAEFRFVLKISRGDGLRLTVNGQSIGLLGGPDDIISELVLDSSGIVRKTLH